MTRYLNYDALVDPGIVYRECSICLNNTQIQSLLAVIDEFQYSNQWFSPTEQEIDTDKIDAFRADIEWRLMSACTDVLLTRFDTNGHYQTSPDGGITWADDPVGDPRNAIPGFPPVVGADGNTKKCDGANSIITWFKGTVASIATAKDSEATASDLGAVLIGILLILGIITAGWIFALLGGLIALIAANYTAAEWRAAFTVDLWQQLLCIVYENENADASFSVTGVETIIGRVEAEMSDTVARSFFIDMLKSLWAGGLTNVARSSLGGALDCAACGDCANMLSWSLFVDGSGTWGANLVRDAGSLTIDAVDLDGTYYVGVQTNADGVCCKLVDAHQDDLSPAPSTAAYHNCGEARGTAGAHAGHAEAGVGTCINFVYYNALTPFTLVLIFEDC